MASTALGYKITWGRAAAVAGTAVLAAISITAPSASAASPRQLDHQVKSDQPSLPRTGQRVGSGALSVVITRDRYGVPSIYGRSPAAMWFGSGWAQAQDRMAQLELTRRAVEGTLSQIFGPGELGQDETVRTLFYTPAELSAQYRAMPASIRRAIAEYSAGINAYENFAYKSAQAAERLVPVEFFALGKALGLSGPYHPAPWRPIDTVAVGNYLAREFGGGGGSELQNLQFLTYLQAELQAKADLSASTDAVAIFNDARWIDDTTAPTTVPSSGQAAAVAGAVANVAPQRPAAISATVRQLRALSRLTPAEVSGAARALASDRQRILATGISLKVLSHGGSNAIAVAPSRSRDHHALLWGAPQEGFGTPSVDGEEYLHAPGYDAGGMYITGEPFILIGRNAHAAWTTTSEENVDQRIYVQQVNFTASPPTYLFDGHAKPMQVLTEQIPVAGQAPVTFHVYRTVDGPIIDEASATTAFSMRFASWGRETGSLTGFAELGGDTNLQSFTHSMSLITTLHNFLYADRAGNIAYFGDGLIPIEPSFAQVDPRLPALGDGTQQWLGFVPFKDMPHSINPAQGYLDNWNTKPSIQDFYQQNSGDEYWGTIFRSTLISKLLVRSHTIDIGYLQGIERAIGTIDNGDNTRPAAPYFIPFLVRAYKMLRAAHDPLADQGTHPDLAGAIGALRRWNGVSTLGSPAMSIFMNFLEAFERNVFEGGLNQGEQYTGAVNFSDSTLGLGTYGGLGGMGTYNLLYHILAHTSGVEPCGTLCYTGDYFNGHRDQLLVESLNDAITILSGTGQQLGQSVPGFGTTKIADWGYQPAQDQNWDSLDPLAQAAGVVTHCGTSPSQNRSTFMMAIDANRLMTGQDVLPPGQSGFISSLGVPSAHLCDQVGLFNSFTYKRMPGA
jgi:penicillin G amidase